MNPDEISRVRLQLPPKTSKQRVYTQEKTEFLKEMDQTRKKWTELKDAVKSLRQGMEGFLLIFLNFFFWGNSVQIEKDICVTEEMNVNQRVLLDKSVETQKEKDSYVNKAIRGVYSDLALVIHEHIQLQKRIGILELQIKSQKENIHNLSKQMEEYSQLLRQAQATIQKLQEPRTIAMKKETVITGYIQSPPLGPHHHKLGPPLFYKKHSQ
ncbi:hypothetical protein BY458DRAFT_445760 [Sporodiniella umbellata]|nr:hypothetical protein BY458DRAFT_445760 [Sporodiniella umbellata]